MTDVSETCDVAIIGYGPVGATLANLLGLRGLSVVVLEREGIAYHLPRAVSFDDEVMRVFQTLGLAERVLPDTHISLGTRFVDAEGRLLVEWARNRREDDPDWTYQGWSGNYRFHQPSLENTLRAGVERFETVSVKTRADVFAIDEHDDHVGVRWEHLASGQLRKTRARYVVGCDGARSLTRRLIGSGMEDLGLHERWLVIDVILNRDKPELGDWTLQHCNPARPATYVRGVGPRRRWEIMQVPADDPETFATMENAWRLLAPWLTPDQARIERATPYMFHAAIATTWRRGRLLLAGDSAHQTPPFLGQGMCAGIRDAANLAWKLSETISGRAAESLLDSYQAERVAHVREFIELAIRMGRLIMTLRPGMADPEKPRALATPRPRLGASAAFDAGDARAGQLAPQPTLSDGTRLDDVVGYRPALLLHPDAPDRRWAAGDGVVVRDAALRGWLDAIGANAVLVRPDRYVERVIGDQTW